MPQQHVASAQYQVTFLKSQVSYTMMLMGATGDVYQIYTGSPLSPASIIPDITAIGDESLKPVIKAVEMASNDSPIQAAAMEWSVNGTKLTFGANGLCTTQGFVGLFKQLQPDASRDYFGLRIMDNLVAALNGAPAVISAVASIIDGTDVASVSASYALKITKSTGESIIVEIYCDPTDSFVLDNDNTSVTAKARVWRGGVEVVSPSLKWALLEDGEWVQKSTASSFLISRDDVATQGTVKVSVIEDGQEIASDIQLITDISDPWVLYPNPNPPIAEINDVGGVSQVVFSPQVKNSDGTQTLAVDKFTYSVLTPAGTSIATGNGSTFTVTRDHCVACGNTGPVLNIEAFINI